MPEDENDFGAFDDLRETMDEEEEEDVERNEETAETDEEESAAESERDPRDEPGFEFEQDLQRPIYPPRDVWDELDDVWEFDVQPQLKEHRIRNISKRELHSAMCRLAIENPDRIAELVLEERGVETAEGE